MVSLSIHPDVGAHETGAVAGAAVGVPALKFITSLRVSGAEQEMDEANAAARENPFAFDPVREAAITDIEIMPTGSQPMVLRTGSMTEPAATLRACVDLLVTAWGFDPTVQKTLSRQAHITNGPTLGRRIIYPRNWVSREIGEIWQFRLDVDATGKPTRCITQSPALGTEYEDLSCAFLMREARIDPALDVSGAPVPSFVQLAMVYTLV